jgi:hypothetical protein
MAYPPFEATREWLAFVGQADESAASIGLHKRHMVWRPQPRKMS